jgi:hypothetical protein
MKGADEELRRVFVELETFGDGCRLDLMLGDKEFAVP